MTILASLLAVATIAALARLYVLGERLRTALRHATVPVQAPAPFPRSIP